MLKYIEIPGNEDAISRLRYSLKEEQNSDKVVAFVGAGPSCEIYPSWGQLSDSLIDFALRRGICTAAVAEQWASKIGKNPERVTTQIKNALPASLYSEFIQQSFSPEEKDAYTGLHWLIQDLPLKALVTTNYDSCALNVASSKSKVHITPAVWNDSESMSPWVQNCLKTTPLPILHAHGIWTHPDSIILSKDEYAKAYKNEDLRRVLENLWIQDTFLFIGFSFADKWVEFLASSILAQHPKLPAKHFAFIGLDEENDFYTSEMRMQFIDQFRIEPIFYYYRGGNHSALSEIIMDLTGTNPYFLLDRAEGVVKSHINAVKNLVNTKNRNEPLSFKSIAVSSGKGGVGKTTIAINLAIGLAKQGFHALLIDADMGLANVDVMLGIVPKYTLRDVFENKIAMKEVLVDGPLGIKFIPSSSGFRSMANLTLSQLVVLFDGFKSIEDMFDIIIIDTSSGIFNIVLDICRSVDEVFLVVRNEPASITDAYALLKVLNNSYGTNEFHIIANQTYTRTEGRDVFSKLTFVADRFLDVKLNYGGCIPDDDCVKRAVTKQSAVVDAYPKCRASQAFKDLSEDIISRASSRGEEASLSIFLEKLIGAMGTP